MKKILKIDVFFFDGSPFQNQKVQEGKFYARRGHFTLCPDISGHSTIYFGITLSHKGTPPTLKSRFSSNPA